jgi:hypothetical protein
MMFSVEILDACKKIVITGSMYYNYYLKTTGTLVFKFHENYYEALTKFYETALKYCGKYENNCMQLEVIYTIYVNLTMMFLKQICTKSPWDRKTRYSKMKEIGRSKEFLHAVEKVDLNRKRKLVCFLLKNQKVNIISMIYLIKNKKSRMAANLQKLKQNVSNRHFSRLGYTERGIL